MTPRYFYVTLDDSDTRPIEYAKPGKYLVIDTGRSGMPDEADVIATATDAVHARHVVQALAAKWAAEEGR